MKTELPMVPISNVQGTFIGDGFFDVFKKNQARAGARIASKSKKKIFIF
jgi:hypothetical protein